MSRYEDRQKTRSCAHMVGGRGLDALPCPAPAVTVATAMARPTITWTTPVALWAGFFLLIYYLRAVHEAG